MVFPGAQIFHFRSSVLSLSSGLICSERTTATQAPEGARDHGAGTRNERDGAVIVKR